MVIYLFGGTQKEKHSFINFLGKTSNNIVVKRSYLQPIKETISKMFDYKMSLISLNKINYVGDVTDNIINETEKESYIEDLKDLYKLINSKNSNSLLNSLVSSSTVDLNNLNNLMYCFVFTDIISSKDLLKVHKYLKKFKVTLDKKVKDLFPAIDAYFSKYVTKEKINDSTRIRINSSANDEQYVTEEILGAVRCLSQDDNCDTNHINKFLTLKVKIESDDELNKLCDFNPDDHVNYDLVISKNTVNKLSEKNTIKELTEKLDEIIIKKYEKQNKVELKEIIDKFNSKEEPKKQQEETADDGRRRNISDYPNNHPSVHDHIRRMYDLQMGVVVADGTGTAA